MLLVLPVDKESLDPRVLKDLLEGQDLKEV